MSKEKTVNYTAEMEARLNDVYGSAETDEARKEAIASLAVEFGKSEASVRAKASTMGIYVKPERTAKDGSNIVKKDELVETIATNIGRASDTLPGLEKANKSTLKALAEATSAKTENVAS